MNLEYQGIVIILIIVGLHFLLFKNYSKETFEENQIPIQIHNCGECFYNKTKTECEKSVTGKNCSTPCKWSSTSRVKPDGTSEPIEFCEENTQFYQIRKF